MRKLLLVVAAILVLGGAAWGVYGWLQGRAEASEQDLAVELAVGETHEISLESNATTGFKWVATFDDKVLELAEERYDEPTGTAMGASGTQVFVFRGLAKGSTTVTFEYKRTFESVPAEQTIEYTFNVK